MSNNKVHFSSLKMDWKTPKAFYQALDSEFEFDHDPAPTKHVIDSLDPQIEWGEVNFCNPPYGRELPKWIEKGYQQWQLGKTVVFLIPSRTDTRWWHDYCMKASEIRFIKGRLYFDDGDGRAPFPSCLVIFRADDAVSDLLATDINATSDVANAPHHPSKSNPKESRKLWKCL